MYTSPTMAHRFSDCVRRAGIPNHRARAGVEGSQHMVGSRMRRNDMRAPFVDRLGYAFVSSEGVHVPSDYGGCAGCRFVSLQWPGWSVRSRRGRGCVSHLVSHLRCARRFGGRQNRSSRVTSSFESLQFPWKSVQERSSRPSVTTDRRRGRCCDSSKANRSRWMSSMRRIFRKPCGDQDFQDGVQ